MRRRRNWGRGGLWGFLAAFAVGSFPTAAAAHSLNVECRLAADALEVVVSFGRGKRPEKGAAVELRDGNGAVVARGQSDEAGVCRLSRPEAGTYRLRAEARDHDTELDVEVPVRDAQAAGDLATSGASRPAWHGWIPWFALVALGLALAACWRLGRRGPPRAPSAPG